jgi:hypothetical protein
MALAFGIALAANALPLFPNNSVKNKHIPVIPAINFILIVFNVNVPPNRNIHCILVQGV